MTETLDFSSFTLTFGKTVFKKLLFMEYLAGSDGAMLNCTVTLPFLLLPWLRHL